MKTQADKNELLAKLNRHQELDEFIKGRWLSYETGKSGNFKGCFYGCTMQSAKKPIEKFSEKYDIDLWYCFVTETIYEWLPYGEYQQFPYQSIKILPLNFDFNKIKAPFHKALLLKQLEWVTNEDVRQVLIKTAKLFDMPFDKISKEKAIEAFKETLIEIPASLSADAALESASGATEAVWGVDVWGAARSALSAARSVSLAMTASTQSTTGLCIWIRSLLFKLIQENS